ncbi:GNAT family N-acetyltransferase [Myxococcota bacterium]|nr:GNAT family N-acetyltransferase [Myxococcota bacterium]
MAVRFETERLILRELDDDDAPFVVALLNQPSFLRFIGDRGVRTEADARNYLARGPVGSYRTHGFGMYLVVERTTGTSLGICGLVRRDTLPDVDLGFAFLPEHWGKGYALEAARATLAEARLLGLPRLLAITDPENAASIRLLEALGLRFERTMRLGDDPLELCVYALDLGSERAPPHGDGGA